MTNGVDADNLGEDEFIVSRIAGCKKVNKALYFLVEWDGYELTENTWEEEGNIYSKDTISKFKKAITIQYKQKFEVLLKSRKKLLLLNTFDPVTKSYNNKSSNRANNCDNISSTNTSRSTVSAIASTILSTKDMPLNVNNQLSSNNHALITNGKLLKRTKKGSRALVLDQVVTSVAMTKKRVRESIESETESVLVSKSVKEARLGVKNLSINKLPSLEKIINSVKDSVEDKFPIEEISKNKDFRLYRVKNLESEVTFYNDVNEEIPSEFIYINELKYSEPVQPPDPNFLSGCSCSRNAACGGDCHDVVAYDDSGRLLIDQGVAIYECNHACGCNKKCKNRVVQRGRKIPLQVFKTKQKGWGVRSRQDIPKGTFIEEYIGEVITVEEGDIRGSVYDKLGCSYLFDMDFAQSELPTKYVIDSYVLGNVSRYFNHSCSPNLEVYAVFNDSADNQLHRLAFFAKHNIRRNEELCFDYNGRRDVAIEEEEEGAARYSCHCGAPDCRKWIYR